VLVAQGLLTDEQVADALAQQRRVGEPLGAVLLTRGLITRRELYTALAQVWGTDMSFVDPLEVDTDLALLFPGAQLARELWLPLRVERDPEGELTVVVATAGRPSLHVAAEVTRRTGVRHVRQVVTTDWDVQRAIRTVWRDELAREVDAVGPERRPSETASRVLLWRQLVGFAALPVVVAVGAVVAPGPTALAVLAVLTLAVAVPTLATAVAGVPRLLHGRRHTASPEALAALDDAALPHYSVLVPVKGDAAVVDPLLRDLAALRYPHEKLEVLLLVEEHDADTMNAALAAAPPSLVRFVVVPHSLPATRGRTLDTGLAFVRGEFVVVYDAGDSPDPDQLRRAVAAFRSGGPDLVCLQARRRPGVGRRGLLGWLWSLDGDPLRGTSAHLRTAALRSLGGWDAFCLTEDTDLVLRARARGLRAGRLDATTLVGPGATAGDWLRERSRVLHGSLQAALVHSRRPWRVLTAPASTRVVAALLVLAGVPVAALALPWLDAVAVAVLVRPSLLTDVVPELPAGAAPAVALAAFGVAAATAVRAAVLAVRAGAPHRALLAPLAPLWALAHSVAAHRALLRLLCRPFVWEHTRRARAVGVHTAAPDRHGSVDAPAVSDGPAAPVAPDLPAVPVVLERPAFPVPPVVMPRPTRGRHAAPEPD
jgi:hypothetical protein